jgi:hypothetical protein
MFGDGTYFTDVSTTALKFAKEDRLGNPINFGKTIDAAWLLKQVIIDLEDLVQFKEQHGMTPALKDIVLLTRRISMKMQVCGLPEDMTLSALKTQG